MRASGKGPSSGPALSTESRPEVSEGNPSRPVRAHVTDSAAGEARPRAVSGSEPRCRGSRARPGNARPAGWGPSRRAAAMAAGPRTGRRPRAHHCPAAAAPARAAERPAGPAEEPEAGELGRAEAGTSPEGVRGVAASRAGPATAGRRPERPGEASGSRRVGVPRRPAAPEDARDAASPPPRAGASGSPPWKSSLLPCAPRAGRRRPESPATTERVPVFPFRVSCRPHARTAISLRPCRGSSPGSRNRESAPARRGPGSDRSGQGVRDPRDSSHRRRGSFRP